MIKFVFICDCCEKELPKHIQHTPLGNIEVVETGKTEYFNSQCVFKHLCKECALKLDNAYLGAKVEMLEKLGTAKRIVKVDG